MFLFIDRKFNGNTSVSLFKYISCSYLSIKCSNKTISAAEFKYISCSYLSFMVIFPVSRTKHSNTSHVLIYLYTYPLSQLYLSYIQIHLMFLFISRDDRNKYGSTLIQIHLMFLFIQKNCMGAKDSQNSNTSHVLIYQERTQGSWKGAMQFKYISCSYLSGSIYAVPESEY